MYDRYFHFKERPFRLVPDPAYLFLSRSHQEAMAHLVYAVADGDGFVALTGEVGTGKTTLCRAFLNQLDAETESAYVFNPPSDPVDLLRAVNRDFGLPAESEDLQELIQSLNAFLIKKKGQGREVLLIVDEAQNLNRHVLEQIRLLSNLETSRSKLLQIILVGQPELREALKTRQLRQLHQRITLNYRLRPLTLPETDAYIRHRLQVASESDGPKFTRAAIRSIFRFSSGIPRLVNMVCDRALLTAYTEDGKVVDGRIVGRALKEFADEGGAGRRFSRHWAAVALTAAVLAIVSVLLVHGPLSLEKSGATPSVPAPVMHPVNMEAVFDASATSTLGNHDVLEKGNAPAEFAAETSVWDVAEYIETADTAHTRSSSLIELVRTWDPHASQPRLPEHLTDDLTFFQLSASQAGLQAYKVESRFEWVKRLCLPAILELVSETSGNRAFVVLKGFDDSRCTLQFPGRQDLFSCDESELRHLWSGNAFVLWKNFFAISGVIPRNAPGESVVTLKLLLRDLGYDDVDLSPHYDDAARRAVMDVQALRNLPVDGVVGSMTKIVLYNMKKGLDIPRLKKEPGAGSQDFAESQTKR